MDKQRIRIEQHSGIGLIWIAGWLFTIGYLGLSAWQGALALFIWPYYLGADLALLHGGAMAPAGGAGGI